MTQSVDQPTNLESRGISCVDLIITDQLNLFIYYGIHSSLDNCCHHQIIHGKVNILFHGKVNILLHHLHLSKGEFGIMLKLIR